MDRKEEIKLVVDAMQSDDIRQNVTSAVRQILNERLANTPYADASLHKTAVALAKHVNPTIRIVHKPIATQHGHISTGTLVGCGVAGVLGLCAINSDNTALRWAGAVAVALGGLAAGCTIGKKASSATQPASAEAQQTYKDIMDETDATYRLLHDMCDRNQLETQYAAVLRFLQEMWADGDDNTKKDIRRLLGTINYEMADYEPQYSDFFDSSRAANISQPLTTKPAVRNLKTGEIVERGHVITPMQ